MSSEKSHWGLHKFSEQSEIRLEWERLSIRIIKRGSDLLLVENRGDTTTSIQLGSDPESDFRRYAFQNPVKEVRVQPRTPNRPLVLQPLHPLRLAPQARVDFYVSVPVDIQLTSQHPSFFTLQSPDSVAKLIRICFIRKLNFLSFPPPPQQIHP